MAVTPPPGYTPPPADLPQRGDRATFSNRVDAWVTWFSTVILSQLTAMITNAYSNTLEAFGFATTAQSAASAAQASAAQAQAAATGTVAAADLIATSTTSVSIGTGVKSFTVQTGKQFKVNMPIRIGVTASPGVYMDGYVRSYDPATGALSFQSERASGSGTYAAWTAMVGTAGILTTGGGGGYFSLTGLASDYLIQSTETKLVRASVASGGAFKMEDPFYFADGYNQFEFLNEADVTYSNDLTLKDITGNHLAYLQPGRSTPVHLKSSAEGWVFPEAAPVGKPVRFWGLASTAIAGSAGVFLKIVELDADRILLLAYGVSLHGFVYNRTDNTSGALTLLRASVSTGAGALDTLMAMKIDTDLVLVATCDQNSTANQVGTLSISGLTITPNATRADAFGAAAVRLVDLIQVGTTFALGYVTSANVARVRAFTVTGSTVNAPGSEAVGPSGYTAAPVMLTTSATAIALVNCNTTAMTIRPYTLSGVTLSAGTDLNAVTSTINGFGVKPVAAAAFRWFITSRNGGEAQVRVFSMNGATPALSAVLAPLNATVNTITDVQSIPSYFNLTVAITGTASTGEFLTEFINVADAGSGTSAPTIVGTRVQRYGLAAQTVGCAGTDDAAGVSAASSWIISSTTGIELHTFTASLTTFTAGRPYRIGPMNYSVAPPVSASYPKESIHRSVLRKNGTRQFALLGDGSKPALYSASPLDLSTMRATPQLIVNPANGAKESNLGRVWLAHSLGPDRLLTIEQVRIA